MRCWALESAGIFLLIFLGSLVFGLAANDPSQPLAMNVVGGGMVGLFAGVLGGWLPGLLLFTIFATRENARRAASLVLEEFGTYWSERTEAMHALPSGRDPQVVLRWLAAFRLPLDDDA